MIGQTPPSDAAADSGYWRSADRYRVLFDSIDEGFCVIEVLFDDAGEGTDYRFVETNPSFERQTGLPNAVGRRMRELAPAHEAHWYRIYGEVATSGRSVRFEQRAEALGRWYDVNAFRVGNPAEHLVAVLFQDISKRKRVELAMLQEQRRKDEFMAILAHELRNPLAPLRSGLQIIERSGGTSDKLQGVRRMMQRQVDHLVKLVEDLVDTSRITRGIVTLDLQRIDLADVVRDALEAAQPAIRDRGHEFVLQLAPAAVPVQADHHRMTQVLTNLLVNAAKYTPPEGRIVLTLGVDHGEALVCVADNGVGIPLDMLEEVFDLFSQVPTTNASFQGGLGIGLAVVSQLVTMHGGTVRAESRGPGTGSTFSVRLPLAAPVAAAAVADAAGAHAPRNPGGRRILIADDNADALEALAMVLRMLGHEVATAADGQAAVEEAARFRPEVAFLDIGMPRLDGLAAARQLRALPLGAQLRLVAVTGWGQDEDRAATARAGFDLHLVKPVSVETIEDLLQTL